MNIFQLMNKVLPGFKKDDLLLDLEQSLKEIDEAIGIYSETATFLDEAPFKSPDAKKLVKQYYVDIAEGQSPFARKATDNIAANMMLHLTQLKTNGKLIYEELQETLNDAVISRALTSYKAVLVRSVSHYFFISRFSLDLINQLYAYEADSLNQTEKKFMPNKVQTKYIERNLWIFGILIAVYGAPSGNFSDHLKKLNDINISQGDEDLIATLYPRKTYDLFDSLPEGFIGSPVLSVRLIYAQWEAERFAGLKDKKRMLELRLSHLKYLKESGKTDPLIEKEIADLQDRVVYLDYKIDRIEKENGL